MKKYNLRVYEVVLYLLAVVLSSVLVFYALQLMMQIVVNYESLSLTSIAPVPMMMFASSVITILIFIYRFRIKGATDFYTRRLYSIIIMSFSFVGMAAAIYTGLGVYGTFIGENIFLAYPLVTLIINALLFLGATLMLVQSIHVISSEKPEKPVVERKHFHRWATVGYVLLTFFALSRFGGVLLLPMLVSPVNGGYEVPFYIWNVIPMLLLVSSLVMRDFTEKGKKAKLTGSILSIVTLLYSLGAMVYMIVIAKYHQAEVLGGISNILFIERLVTIPVDFIALTLVTVVLPLVNVCIILFKKIREQK